DEAEVRLDHALLRLHVAALDLLRELDLLRRGEESVSARLAQEELQRIGRRLVGRLERGRGRLLLLFLLRLLDDVDSPAVELGEERVRLERIELVEIDRLDDVQPTNRAG